MVASGTNLQNTDWAAAGALIVVILALGETARRGWQAPDLLYAHYRDNRAQTKASLDADHILPELASLVADVNREVSLSVGATEALTDVQTLLDNLQWAGYRDRLDRLSHLYADYGLVDRLFDAAVAWARRKAVGSGAAAVSLLVLAIPLVFTSPPIPALAVGLASVVLVLSTVGVVVCWALEVSARNRLGRLFRTYE